jgi:hypothetical protein
MTPFGTEWIRMLAAGEVPRESMFAEQHSPEWHAGREECRRRVEEARKAKAAGRAA